MEDLLYYEEATDLDGTEACETNHVYAFLALLVVRSTVTMSYCLCPVPMLYINFDPSTFPLSFPFHHHEEQSSSIQTELHL